MSDEAREFLIHCTFGETWRRIEKAPLYYRNSGGILIKARFREIVHELLDDDMAALDDEGHLYINMSKQPALAAEIFLRAAGEGNTD